MIASGRLRQLHLHLDMKLSRGRAALYLGTSSSMGRVRRFTGLQRVVEGEGANSQGENGSVLKPFPSEIRVWVRCIKHYNITRIQLHANRTIQGGTELCSLTSATNEILHVNEVAIVDGLTMSTTRVSRER